MSSPVGLKTAVNTRGITGVVNASKSRQIAMKGLRAGIRILVHTAKSGAPVGSGALRKAQGYRVAKGRKVSAFAAQGVRVAAQKQVGSVIRKPAKYDHLVQGGVKPHRLGSGEKLSRHRVTKFAEIFQPATSQSTGGRHPGVKPNPYRRRAYQREKDRINTVILQEMGAELQRVIARESAKMPGG